jgi:hypothetical protein
LKITNSTIAKATTQMFEVDDPQLLYEAEEHEATKQGSMNYKHPCTCCHGAK